MVKAGVITGAVSLVLGIGFALLSPICVPCIALFLGIGAGFLAGMFDKPLVGNETLKTGALAGVISGIGLALGQTIGAVLNSILVGPERAARMLENLGVQAGGTTIVGPGYWAGVIGSTVCFGVVDVVLMAIFGILGALAWGAFLRRNEDSGIIDLTPE